MPHYVRTARGKTIDFDLMKVKAQIEATPKPVNVEEREKFIDRKLRRKLRKAKREAAAKKKAEQPIDVDENTEDEPIQTKSTRRRVKRQ